MSLSDDHLIVRYRNLLIVLANEVQRAKARAADLRDAAAKEPNKGRAAGMRTLLHCQNRNVQLLAKLLGRNSAATRHFFGTTKPEEVAKQGIILH